MNAKKILCPIDYSENSQLSLNYAASLAKESDAELHIVFCYENIPPYEAGFGTAMAATVDTEAQKAELEKVVPKEHEVRYCHELLHGSPMEELTRYSDENEIDLIVMGTHGRKGLSRILMGSVAEAVLRNANCPVLTIRQHADHLEPSQ